MIWLNNRLIEFSNFPNNEIKMNEKQVIEAMEMNGTKILFKYQNDSDLIKLIFLKEYIDCTFSIQFGKHNSELTIYYMPYSRMDRSQEGSAFTLKYVAELINSLKFSRVKILEPHSDVTLALVDNSYPGWISLEILGEVVRTNLPSKIYNYITFDINSDYIYFPDAGAEKRYSSEVNIINKLMGIKHRNFQTGKIESLQIVGDTKNPLIRNRVIMIDDLCSKGGTFSMAARQLKKIGAEDIYLVVTHCEDTIEQGNILTEDDITAVYTTNSILTIKHPKLHVYEIEKMKDWR